jgi:thiol-disulfide isomerase/thioredoxin
MMKLKILVYIFMLFGVCHVANAQSLSGVKKVNVGDDIPDYPLKNIINYPVNEVNLNTFKGKILILDFWTFGCSACVASWPKLMKLQDEFKDKIQIMLVNVYETENKVTDYIQKQEKIGGYKLNLPVACGDKTLKEFFPHDLVPHVVFIDQQGKVKYIAEGRYLNEKTIQNMLENKNDTIPEKTDDFSGINWTKPLFINGNMGKLDTVANLNFTTLITPYSSEVLGVSSIEGYKELSMSCGFMGNTSLKDMYRILYGRSGDMTQAITNSRVWFKNMDSVKMVSKINDVFQPKNLYTIQVWANKYIAPDLLRQKMISDLDLYFGLKTSMGKQKKMCLVISRSKRPLTVYKSGDRVLKMGKTTINVNQITMQELIDGFYLNPTFYRLPYPLVDETGFKGKLGAIYYKTTDRILDYKVLGEELAKHGLKFSIQERETNVLIISKAE